MNICICGGGNISHALAGILSHNGNYINVLTRKPHKWSKKIMVTLPDDKKIIGNLKNISNQAKNVIPHCHIIIISVPIYAINDIFEKIKLFLTKKMTIIGIPGRLYSLYNKNFDKINQIYILRTPYISRISKYGNSVTVSGYCYKGINYWSNNFDKSNKILENLFNFKLNKITNIESVNLVNSNTILHPARLYSLFKDKKEYDKIPLFYGEWNLESSEILLECDKELFYLITIINQKNKNNKIYVKGILEHYESNNAIELTNKIKSIKSFSKIYTLMIQNNNNKFICDINSRYITEDIFIGMKYLIDKSNKYHIDIPYIKKIYYHFKNY